ncbi:MAG: SufD family Fe-S cluster assembly protein [Candidatus Micrarchaeota archaeon]
MGGKILAKGIFRDAAKGLFRGMADIGEKAVDSKSYISSHSVLLGGEASSDAIPGLQIRNNDVKATHSASVARIDEEQMFYLMSRGLSKEEAEKTILSGFLEPIIRQMRLPEVQIRMRALFELKWEGSGIDKLPEKMKNIREEGYFGDGSEAGIFEGHYKYR